ncbi:MAG: thioredoxin family protein [Bacteroidota bacterium]
MKFHVLPAAALLIGVLAASSVRAADQATVDAAAPVFTLPDAYGKTHALADYRGKYVVLEWVNFDCPFVHKHYGSGAMQTLQRAVTEQGIIWLSVCSSAPGKQGYFAGKDLHERIAEEKASPTAYLLDTEGTVGRAYGAKTTPHMFVIDPKGVVIYAGGIDDIASTDFDDIGRATNYVKGAVEAAMAGKPVPVKTSRSYGCSVKYK